MSLLKMILYKIMYYQNLKKNLAVAMVFCLCVALLPPLLPPLLMRTGHKLRCTFSSPVAFALHSQQQAKVLCWRLRTGHKLLA
jgi:hypothetical protein